MNSASERRTLFQRSKGASINAVVQEDPDGPLLDDDSRKDGVDKLSIALSSFQLGALILYWVFGRFPSESNAHDVAESLELYGGYFQEIAVMIIIGFGFLTSFLRRHRFGSLTYVLMITIVSFQLSMLTNAFFFSFLSGDGTLIIDVQAAMNGLFTAASVLICFGVVIGKVNGEQVFAITISCSILQGLNNWLCVHFLGTLDFGGTIVIHCFGAFFGLGATLFLSPRDISTRSKYASSDYNSDTFALLATFFLWVFWPSFVAATAPTAVSKVSSVLSTLLALSGSSVATLICSRVFRSSRKFTMEDIQNSTLSGGVAIGSAAAFLTNPGPAILIGMVSGVVSVLGYAHIGPFLGSKGIHDTAGALNLHGYPSVIGAIASTIVFAAAGNSAWWRQLAGLGVTLVISILGGGLTGFLMSKSIEGPFHLFNDLDAFQMSVLCNHAGDGCQHRECGHEYRVDPRTTLLNLQSFVKSPMEEV